jgi:hypothetical protein
MPVEYTIPQCEHIRTNGTRCGSPALKKKQFCFYHNRMIQPQYLTTLPALEDADAIQLAVWRILRGILARYIDPKDAGHLFYGLQIASHNLKQTRPQPYWKNVERVDPAELELEIKRLDEMKTAGRIHPAGPGEGKLAG